MIPIPIVPMEAKNKAAQSVSTHLIHAIANTKNFTIKGEDPLSRKLD